MKFRIVPVDVPAGELMQVQRGSRLVIAAPPDADQVHDVAPGEAVLVRVVKPKRAPNPVAAEVKVAAPESPADDDGSQALDFEDVFRPDPPAE